MVTCGLKLDEMLTGTEGQIKGYKYGSISYKRDEAIC